MQVSAVCNKAKMLCVLPKFAAIIQLDQHLDLKVCQQIFRTSFCVQRRTMYPGNKVNTKFTQSLCMTNNAKRISSKINCFI